ncbi:MAG: hypothetical protein ICV73_19480 [Acetobacteraceae bacterium]|nr:hypothetical protein [Acetobacteraceae bacterium]
MPPACRAGAFAAVLAFAACAQSPETIAPAPVDEARFAELTCADMGLEMALLNRRVAALSTEQSAKRTNDAVGWTHLLHPAHSARVRDIRSYIALGKGELDALERAMARRCPGFRL